MASVWQLEENYRVLRMIKKSSRGEVSPFYAMEILKEANRMEINGCNIMHMETGEPGNIAPSRVIRAAHKALECEELGYTEAEGFPPLRKRIIQHYKDFYGIDVEYNRVAVTLGSSGGLLLAFIAAFDVGDRVAMASPSYPAYRNVLKSLGIEVIELHTSIESRFQPTVNLLKELDKPIQGLIIASPSNPTGTMIPTEELKNISKFCDDVGIRIISDEIYHGITYERRADSVLSYSSSAVVANGFSKYFAMTGWRLGWVVLPHDLVRSIELLAQNFFISPPALAQHAAIAAFDCRDELEENVRMYAENRKILLEALPRAGFSDLAPSDGAFYIYAKVTNITNNSEYFCREMLNTIGVAATPGIDFDQRDGNQYVRFSYAAKTETVRRSAELILDWLSNSKNAELKF